MLNGHLGCLFDILTYERVDRRGKSYSIAGESYNEFLDWSIILGISNLLWE
jgi:hypothetical protein